VRSSFDTTITVLDGLGEFERATGGSAAVRDARRGGEQYLLDRSLFRRKSTGEVVNPEYLDFAFPYYWHYDVLRALDYFRRSGAADRPRGDGDRTGWVVGAQVVGGVRGHVSRDLGHVEVGEDHGTARAADSAAGLRSRSGRPRPPVCWHE
jgi:hypothetical protein